MLSNRIYIGQMVHKGEFFDGEHPAIVPIDLWDAVQGKMKANASGTSRRLKSLQPSLLVGLVFDGEGRPMTPSHATKPGRRYRYYITRPDQLNDAPAWRVSAYDLEQIICDQLSALLTDQQFVCDMVSDATAETVRQALASADLAAATLRSGTARDKALLLPRLVSRIDLQEEGVDLAIDRAGLVEVLGMGTVAPTSTEALVLTLPATKVRHGHQLRLIIPGPQILNIPPATRDEKLVGLIAEAHAARKIILAAPEQSIASIAASHGRCRTRLGKLAALACLAPDIVTAIVEGRQPASITARTLQKIDLPLAWPDQRALLGFA